MLNIKEQRLIWWTGTLLATSILIGLAAYLAEIAGLIPRLIGPYRMVGMVAVVGAAGVMSWWFRRNLHANPVWANDEREGQIRLISVWVAHYVTLASLWLALTVEIMQGLHRHSLPGWFHLVILLSFLDFCLTRYLRGSWKP